METKKLVIYITQDKKEDGTETFYDYVGDKELLNWYEKNTIETYLRKSLEK